MTELINKLVAEAGLTSEQAAKTLDVVKEFVKEKFPMLSGAVDNVFGNKLEPAAVIPAIAEAQVEEKASWLDKISDVIPGDIGEKLEGMAKTAADKAEDLYDKGKNTAEDLYEKGKARVDGFMDKK
ncbi:hypothetical protein BH10BAC3_BH10BAC3_22930 [soil metagenome]